MIPCTPVEAVARALALVGHGVYHLGTGDCDTPDDEPSDCAGFAICKCYQVRRHEPGLNRGNPCGVDGWDVEDDWNSNSLLADAYGAKTKFRALGTNEAPAEGDLIAYPTIRIADAHGEVHVFIGHVAIVTDASRWDGTYASLTIAQCCGPNGRKPGIISSSGKHFDDQSATWPKPEHRTRVLKTMP